MHSRRRTFLFGLAILAALACSTPDPAIPTVLAGVVPPEHSGDITQGALVRLDDTGEPAVGCPLKHTDVQADISGFLARVKVTQQFQNPYPEAIEAVYVFPLPQAAAVDDMTMTIGDRIVKGKIKERQEARRIYEQAKKRGNLASLLDQERPNIFTQSVANIPPGASVDIEISYVETLAYEEGRYEFSFPMVVGPRYIPGSATSKTGGGWAPNTDQVPDASHITPPVARPETRAGHDIAIAVNLDAGLPVDRIVSKTHDVDLDRTGRNGASVRLRQKSVLPNKDFILTYGVAGGKVEDALLTHRADRGGFFSLILQPPERVTQEDVTPKELVFVLDVSGSMSGFPIEKAKEVIHLALEGLYPRDTFNLVTFAGATQVLFPAPVPGNTENINKAQQFLKTLRGGGGTEMMKAIRTALEPSDSQEHVRIVCFMTDGYVGNDMAILGEVQKHSNARVFSFGIGNSVNRFLLDKMAEAGRGEVEYVTLKDDGSAAARRFHERVRNPLLTDISVDWAGLPVSDVYPKRIPDLFSAKPLTLSGRYSGRAAGTIRLSGRMSGREWTRELRVSLPTDEPEHDVLATLWARRRVDNLMASDWKAIQSGSPRPEVKREITQLGLDYRLMTQFTSFVAVEETTVTEGGVPKRIDVPVEMPEGVSFEGVFGAEGRQIAHKTAAVRAFAPAVMGQSRLREAAPMPSPTAGPGAVRYSTADAVSEQVTGEREESFADVAMQKIHTDLLELNPTEKVEVEIWLSDNSAETMAQLKQLGLEVTKPSRFGKVLIGRVDAKQLKLIARLTAVRYIAPHRQ